MSKYITTHAELVKLHGRSVTCKIKGAVITDGKIAVELRAGDTTVFICQNGKEGCDARDKLGYSGSWLISDQRKYEGLQRECTGIELVEPSYAIGHQLDIEASEVLVAPSWVQRGKAVLCYLSDSSEEYLVKGGTLGYVVAYDPTSEMPFRDHDNSKSTITENLALDASELSFDDISCDTIGWVYAKPVPLADIEEARDPNATKIAELESTVEKALEQIKELKEK